MSKVLLVAGLPNFVKISQYLKTEVRNVTICVFLVGGFDLEL